MGIIQQKGQFSGKAYSIQIAGDTPTAAEQQKIDSYLTQQEQPYKQSYEYYFGQRTNEDVPQEVPIQEEGGFRRAVGAGVDQLQIAYGSSLEGLGKVTGLEGLENYGSDVIEKNEQEFQEKAAGFTKLDDADSFLETGLTLEMSASEIDDQFVSLDVSISEGEITNIQNSSEATNALNTSMLTAEKIEYKTTIDIPFGPVVPLAEFRGNVSDETGAGTRRLRDVQLFGKLFGVSTNDVTSKNALILISASKMDVLTAQTTRDNAYEIFQDIYEGDILAPPTKISLLPTAVSPIEFNFKVVE